MNDADASAISSTVTTVSTTVVSVVTISLAATAALTSVEDIFPFNFTSEAFPFPKPIKLPLTSLGTEGTTTLVSATVSRQASFAFGPAAVNVCRTAFANNPPTLYPTGFSLTFEKSRELREALPEDTLLSL